MNKEIFLTPKELADITGGIWENLSNDLTIHEIHETYHYLNPYDMFVVHYDDWYNKTKDNEYRVSGAIKKSISALMLRRDSSVKTTIPTLKVENTYEALRKIALYTSQLSKAKRVLITGSYGKTGFKVQLYNIIKKQINTYTRLNSSNMVVATYCNLASLKSDTELFLIEQPVSTLKKTYRRATYVKPDISVITSIGHEGIERFKTIDNIIENKLQIAHALNEGGKLLLPYDDRYFDKLLKEAKKYTHIEILTYGSNRTCNANILYKKFSDFGWDVIAKIEDVIVAYRVPFFEEYAVSVSCGVLLCAYHLGLDVHKAADEYYKNKNFKSSGLFYQVTYKEKKIYLYDQSNRGGIEGYESFFKTLSYIKPNNDGKKILVTSEFVDYKDGEMKFIDTKKFQKLIKNSGISHLFSVEKFSEHINVLKDKSIWKNHSIDFNNIKDEIIDSLEESDMLCIKGIFGCSLTSFVNYIKKLNGIKIEEFKYNNTSLVYNENQYYVKILDETYISQLYDMQITLDSSNDEWFSKDTFLKYIIENHVHGIFSFENKDKLLGFCVLKQRNDWKEIFEISVDKSYQKKGLGSRLLINCINSLIASNQKNIYLMVNTKNENAIQIYKHIGFKIIKEKKSYFRSGNDAFEMDFVW